MQSIPDTKPKTKRLNLRQQKVIQAVKAGAPNMATALRAAGYAPNTVNKNPERVLGVSVLRDKLLETIESMDLHSKFKDNWHSMLSLPDATDKEFTARAALALKAQDQIARIAGLEANKRVEKAVVTWNVDNVLPKGDVVTVRAEPVPTPTQPQPQPNNALAVGVDRPDDKLE